MTGTGVGGSLQLPHWRESVPGPAWHLGSQGLYKGCRGERGRTISAPKSISAVDKGLGLGSGSSEEPAELSAFQQRGHEVRGLL